MSKEKNRTIDVDVDGKTVKIVVRRPSGSINTKASRVAAKISKLLTAGRPPRRQC